MTERWSDPPNETSCACHGLATLTVGPFSSVALVRDLHLDFPILLDSYVTKCTQTSLRAGCMTVADLTGDPGQREQG